MNNQGYNPPENNSTPLITESYSPIVKNQNINQAAVNNLKHSLRSQPQKICCPYCDNYDFTKVDQNKNYCNIAFCALSLYIPWCITKFCKRKDFNCLNAKHTCSKCNNELADYDAC